MGLKYAVSFSPLHQFYSKLSSIVVFTTVQSDQLVSATTSLLLDETTVFTASHKTIQNHAVLTTKSPFVTHTMGVLPSLKPSGLFTISSRLSKEQTTSFATKDSLDASTKSYSINSSAQQMPRYVARPDCTSTAFRGLSQKQTIRAENLEQSTLSPVASYTAKTKRLIGSITPIISQELSLTHSQPNYTNNSTTLFTSSSRNKKQNDKLRVHRSRTAVYVILIGMPIASFILITTCVYCCVVKPRKPREIVPAEPAD